MTVEWSTGANDWYLRAIYERGGHFDSWSPSWSHLFFQKLWLISRPTFIRIVRLHGMLTHKHTFGFDYRLIEIRILIGLKGNFIRPLFCGYFSLWNVDVDSLSHSFVWAWHYTSIHYHHLKIRYLRSFSPDTMASALRKSGSNSSLLGDSGPFRISSSLYFRHDSSTFLHQSGLSVSKVLHK